MSKIKDTFFGGAEKKASRREREGLAKAREAFEAGIEKAETKIGQLFPAAEQNLQLGFQGALDVFGQTAPQQLGAFQTGNVGAQEALIAGVPQFQNAILGLPAGVQQQATQIPIDTSFAQQQLPQFISSQEALNPAPQLGAGSFNQFSGPFGIGNEQGQNPFNLNFQNFQRRF